MNIVLISFLILFKAFNSDFFNIDFNKIINVLFNIHKTLLSKKKYRILELLSRIRKFFYKTSSLFSKKSTIITIFRKRD